MSETFWQIRAATRIGIDEKDGYGASVFASFITHCPALAGLRLVMTAYGKHLVSSLRQNYLREKIYVRFIFLSRYLSSRKDIFTEQAKPYMVFRVVMG